MLQRLKPPPSCSALSPTPRRPCRTRPATWAWCRSCRTTPPSTSTTPTTATRCTSRLQGECFHCPRVLVFSLFFYFSLFLLLFSFFRQGRACACCMGGVGVGVHAVKGPWSPAKGREAHLRVPTIPGITCKPLCVSTASSTCESCCRASSANPHRPSTPAPAAQVAGQLPRGRWQWLRLHGRQRATRGRHQPPGAPPACSLRAPPGLTTLVNSVVTDRQPLACAACVPTCARHLPSLTCAS